MNLHLMIGLITFIMAVTYSPRSWGSEERNYETDFLLFAGDGTWVDEVASIEDLLIKKGASYQIADSIDLNRLSLHELSQFGAIIFPGGSGTLQTESLSHRTRARLRQAVQKSGVSYIGFCAGAFIAVAPTPEAGQDVSYGLGIVTGPELKTYYLENKTESAMTLETFADGTQRDLVWYGGPVTIDTPGTIVATYPNGEPAISETWSGQGFVVLSGPHPAASQSFRDDLGLEDSDGLDFDLAWSLLEAGLHRHPLPVFKK